MNFEYRRITLGAPNQEDARYTFENSFPEEERPPYEMALSWENNRFHGVYHNDEFVALADVVEYEDLVYLFFLAVKEECRGRGIGTQILTDLKERYSGKRLFLLAEEAEPKYADYAQRIRRLGFYHRNGFDPSGVKILEFGVMYDLLTLGALVSQRDFLSLTIHLIGEEMAHRFYGHLFPKES